MTRNGQILRARFFERYGGIIDAGVIGPAVALDLIRACAYLLISSQDDGADIPRLIAEYDAAVEEISLEANRRLGRA